MVAQFGNYLLDEEIARGGMARVYRARLRGLGGFEKTLVVKQVLPELANDPRFVEMFVDEAKTLVQMSHPHVVPVYELGVIDGVYFLAMEHVDGATLANVLRDGPLTPALAAHAGVQVCDALDYAHRRFGLVHRDVTPRNIIIDPIGHVRLLDFGIAAPAEDDDDSGVFGSPGYMSPEQARGDSIGPGSDLFSLGVVLYEALTGERAFLRESPEHSRAALLGEPPPQLSERDGVPAELAEVVDRALSHDPTDRPASAARMGKALRGWIATSHPEGVGPELGDRAEQARERQRQRRSDPSGPLPGSDGETPSRRVRTLATSPALEAMLEGQPETAPAEPNAEWLPGDAGTGASGTVPLERASRRSDASEAPGEPGTVPLEGRRSQPPARGRRLALWGTLAALVAATAVGVLVPRGGDNPPPARGDADASRGAGAQAAGDEQTGDALSDEGAADARLGEAKSDGGAASATAGTEPGGDADEGTLGEPDDGRAGERGSNASGGDRDRGPAESSARLTVSAVPWADVRLDGRPTSPRRAPLRGIRIPPGSHRLELSCPPLGTRGTVSFEAEPGGHVRIRADLNADPPDIAVR